MFRKSYIYVNGLNTNFCITVTFTGPIKVLLPNSSLTCICPENFNGIRRHNKGYRVTLEAREKKTRTGGADEGEEEVESEERESRRRLGPGHEVEEAEVGEERDGEQLRRHALGVHGGRPRVHGEQPAPHHHPARRRRSPLHPASAAEAIASPGSTGGARQVVGSIWAWRISPLGLGGSRSPRGDEALNWAGPSMQEPSAHKKIKLFWAAWAHPYHSSGPQLERFLQRIKWTSIIWFLYWLK